MLTHSRPETRHKKTIIYYTSTQRSPITINILLIFDEVSSLCFLNLENIINRFERTLNSGTGCERKTKVTRLKKSAYGCELLLSRFRFPRRFF